MSNGEGFIMKPHRVFAWFLIALSAVFLFAALSGFILPGGNMKGLGAFLFPFSMFALLGWSIGDF